MKNLKLFQKIFRASIVIFFISVLGGCDDQITSSGEPGTEFTPGNTKEMISPVNENLSLSDLFETPITLKPFRSYTFNASNTGFAQLNSIYIENLTPEHNTDKTISECYNLFVYGNTFHESIVLDCSDKGFDVREITIENLSSRMLDLNVSLGGIKKKFTIPVDRE